MTLTDRQRTDRLRKRLPSSSYGPSAPAVALDGWTFNGAAAGARRSPGRRARASRSSRMTT